MKSREFGSRKCIGLLIFHDFLLHVIDWYLKTTGIFCSFPVQRGQTCLSQQTLARIEAQDIFIVEAFDTLTFGDPKGFRFVSKCIQIGLSMKPLVIFPVLGAEFLTHPCLLDYRGLSTLPEKLEHLDSLGNLDYKIFDALIQRYSSLNKKPTHF